MTFVEISLVIAIMLALVGMLFLGVRAWRVGADRAGCLMAQRNVQMAVRSYQNMYEYNEGGTPTASDGSQSIVEHLYQREFVNETYYRYLLGELNCPGNGAYSVPNPTVFPAQGELFIRCSLGETHKHDPSEIDNW